jgi:hypothetical protein
MKNNMPREIWCDAKCFPTDDGEAGTYYIDGEDQDVPCVKYIRHDIYQEQIEVLNRIITARDAEIKQLEGRLEAWDAFIKALNSMDEPNEALIKASETHKIIIKGK